MKSSTVVYRAGRIWGRCALRHVLRWYDRRCSTFALSTIGTEHLRAVASCPYLLVANHIQILNEEGPLAQILQRITRRPVVYNPRLDLFNSPSDSFVLRRIVREETGGNLRVVARSNRGVWSKRPLARQVQEQFSHPFGNGLRVGLGYLPVDPTGLAQREFLHSVKCAMSRGEPILIFPGKIVFQGEDRGQDTLLDGCLHPGAAHLARRCGIPILPAYISGAEGWRLGQEAEITFGPAFDCAELTKAEVSREIVAAVLKCKYTYSSVGHVSDANIAALPNHSVCD